MCLRIIARNGTKNTAWMLWWAFTWPPLHQRDTMMLPGSPYWGAPHFRHKTLSIKEDRKETGEGVCATINVWPADTDSLHLWLFFCTRKAASAFSSTAPRRMPHPRLLLRGDIRKGLLGNGTKSAILLLPHHFYLMTKTSKSPRRKYARNVLNLKSWDCSWLIIPYISINVFFFCQKSNCKIKSVSPPFPRVFSPRLLAFPRKFDF